MNKLLLIGISGLSLLAGPGSAADFKPPLGCQSYLTLQSRGCEVSIYYTCAADPEGHQWRADFGINGKSYEAQIDAEGQWIFSVSYASGIIKRLNDGAKDPASLSTLFSEGYDSMDFSQTDRDGNIYAYKGYDKLTGESVVIDGVTLKRTEFQFTEYDATGAFVRRVKGNEFVSEEFNRFFGGVMQIEQADGSTYPADGSPIDFILPGEPGFGSTIPLFECSDMMSGLFPLPGGAG